MPQSGTYHLNYRDFAMDIQNRAGHAQARPLTVVRRTSWVATGVANSGTVSTVFDGISRHTREGYAFQMRSATVGFREAVRERDEPFGDWKRARFEK